ncbi:hypothetical protein DYB36_012298 [Aphanomyces astaci]|uniref:DDE Tnp4 domain-containing protein n=1 Tax=Aphanomyces astaci TaxID=112090 RepID=A0A397BT24_APHAT|nr:hypothetical protein DYB36_012298 [Aphanomyces astaci]
MLERLQVQAVSDQHYLEECFDVIDAVVDEENAVVAHQNPVIDKVLEDSGADGFRTLTSFTPAECETIWGFVETPLCVRWTDGLGRKPMTTPKDVLFMTLVILKHYQTWEKHAVDFSLNAQTLEKIIIRPRLHLRSLPIRKVCNGRQIPACAPSFGRFSEQKQYFSGKHNLYGLKIAASVSPHGRMVNMSPQKPGSEADLTIFRNRHDIYAVPEEGAVNDNGEKFQAHPTM